MADEKSYILSEANRNTLAQYIAERPLKEVLNIWNMIGQLKLIESEENKDGE